MKGKNIKENRTKTQIQLIQKIKKMDEIHTLNVDIIVKPVII